MEQKKMLKTGLSITHFRRYVPLIEKETVEYLERWGDSGEKGIVIIIILFYFLLLTRIIVNV